jgi:hypothetical protein
MARVKRVPVDDDPITVLGLELHQERTTPSHPSQRKFFIAPAADIAVMIAADDLESTRTWP